MRVKFNFKLFQPNDQNYRLDRQMSDEIPFQFAKFLVNISRRLYGTNHNYYVTKNDMLSARWTAPEVLLTLCHSLKADVWSFGKVIMLKITVHNFPAGNLPNLKVLGTAANIPAGQTHSGMSSLYWDHFHTLVP